MSKVLVAYFSVSGVTKKVAEELAKVKEADLFEIMPEAPYTAEDLDYMNQNSRSTLEMKDPSCRPAVVGQVENMAQYETVFVGFPIWWGREPSVVDTFLDGYDFGGKKIVPFCTSGGSEIGETAKRIREIVGEFAVVEEGTRLGGTVSEEELKTWTAGIEGQQLGDSMSKQIDEETLKILLSFQQAELDGVVTYKTLENLTDDELLKEAFRKTAADEGRHAAILKSYTGVTLKPDDTSAQQLAAALKTVDMPTLLEGISKGEYTGYDMYATFVQDFPRLESVREDEIKHGKIMAAEAERLRETIGGNTK